MYFIDVQGTLISDNDKSPLKGSIEFINMLNEKKIPYMVVTNNTKKKSKVFYSFLQDLGFNFDYGKYLDPLMLLESRVCKDSVAAYGAEEFLNTLVEMGYTLDYKNPKTVLLAIKEDFRPDEYAEIIDFLLAGASLVGMHETSIYAKNNKRYPGLGAILKLLEFATSVSYEVIGKPSDSFYEKALSLLQNQKKDISFTDIEMISDDVKGDLGGAKELGMKTSFVTSGKYKTQEEIVPFLKENLKPDFVYGNMQEILDKRKLEIA
ncbi:MAG: HAD-IIA family hydrolase [Sulfurimonas sp.]|nr:HAD-IIA family hydrolase [Sulfurimonas sp.]MDQ7059787.1 HAD-IIA family hydrolase [Sulfurimonas sp.]